jgi:hypothetical protein
MPLEQDKASHDWIRVLLEELRRRGADYERRNDYYTGAQGQRFVATGYRALFARAFEWYRENICATVVEYVDNRLDLTGFTFPSAQDQETAEGDPAAWQIWQDNQLDVRSQLAHSAAMVKGLAYILVSPFAADRVGPGQRSPRITIEQPTETIVAFEPGGTARLVGLKTWHDATTGRRYVNLYYPDRIEKFQSGGRDWANQWGRGFKEVDGAPMERRYVEGEAWPLRHTLGVVPIVPMVNRPRLGSGMFAGIECASDIDDVIPVQDAINFLALNGIVASDKAAFPQKWATGVEIPVDPKTGKPNAEWQPDIDTILSTRAPDAKFGNFDVAELGQYDTALRGKLEIVSLQTHIPISNFLRQTGQPASGEAREAADASLTKKIERRQVWFGEPWEEALRLGFRSLGDETRANDTSCEAEWDYAGIEPSAAKVDAIQKQRALNVPYEVLWRLLGHSPTIRRQFRRMLERERTWLSSTPTERTEPDALPGPGAVPPVVELAAQGEPAIDSAGG